MEAIKENNPDKAEELANQHMLNAYENMVDKGLLDLYES
jgi:DNA-binding GntR family transcriptional regulator